MKSKVSPWDDEDKSVFKETADLVNPFNDLRHDRISPDQPPLSLSLKKPMIAAKVGAFGGASTRVWVSPEERLCFPKLKKIK